MAKSESEIDRDIDSLVGTMAIEGLTLDDDDIADCRAILRGELDVDDRIAEIIEKYKTQENAE